MPIELSPADREHLEQIARRRPPTKRPKAPTRRQKATALLLLAEGLPTAGVVEQVGISAEEVESLAANFAERGLEGFGLGPQPPLLRIQLVRPGIRDAKFNLPLGATVADLLSMSGATTATIHDIVINEKIAEGSTLLSDGMIVVIAPPNRNVSENEPGIRNSTGKPRMRTAVGDEPWRATIPAFQDEDLFRAYQRALEDRREAEVTEEDSAE